MKHPKLRDSKRLLTNELYSIGDIPQEYIVKIGGHVVYLIHSGPLLSRLEIFRSE